MKISVWSCTNILKICESLKHDLKVSLHWCLRIRLNASLIIIILLHVLDTAAADENTGSKCTQEDCIANVDERKNSSEKQHVLSLEKNAEEKEAHGVKRYKVADIEFQRVETPILIAMWIFCASLAKICFHMAPDLNQKVPESCLLIVVGVVIGLVLWCIKNIHITALTPDTFFIYMLPPIILDAGYFMPNRLFFDNLGTILMFAVVGTIFNTLTIGGSLWLVNAMGFFDGDTSVLELFLFAALISAVDPVAVLAVFEEIHVNEILYIVVFGESLLNDAVTVVLYHMFEAYNQMGPSNILYTDLLASIASFLVVAMGGTIIGVLWGFLTGFVTRFTHQARVIEPILILVMAYISYLNAEMFHMSGILAITFCGITMKNYVEANISHKSHTTVKYTMKMLSSSSETIIFMFLGVSTVSENHHWNMSFIILTIIFCTIYRFAGVMLLSALVNHFRLYKLNTVDKFVMSYGGLRGAVAFALALLINPRHVKSREMFVSTTIAVIYFTVFIQGITIRPLVKILNVKKAEKKKPTMNERIHERFMDHMMAGIEDILGHHGNHHLRDRYKRFDNQFIRPYLLKSYQGAEPKILETYSKLAMKDALDFMRRNASTLGNISNAESASGIFRSYTAANLPASSSCSQIDGAWNVDLQEMDYNPSKKDLTDAKIHHLLAAELCQSTKKTTDPLQHRRLSYSRHVVDERDLLQLEIQCTNSSLKRSPGGDSRRHHHRRSKRSGRMNHVTFPPTKQNSNESVDKPNERKNIGDDNNDSDEWDTGITFTVNPATLNETDSRLQMKKASNSYRHESHISEKQIADIHLPWQRFGCDETEDEFSAVEMKIPWRRNEEESELDAEIMKKREYPYWDRSKEYLPYSSRGSTNMGKNNERPKLSSVLNLFRKDRSRCSIARLESNDSLDRRYSATVIQAKSQRTGSVTTTFLSPYRDSNSPLRRGSMMELGAGNNKVSDEDFFAVTYQNSDGSPRFRSGSMCIPRRKDGFLTISTKASSSSSSSSDSEESFG